jgi:tetratricopeptide (TPR) repeat protein
MDPSDKFHLSAATGWLELGNPTEAHLEWKRITESLQKSPEALEVLWRIFAAGKQWDEALETARELVATDPENPVGWIDRSFSLHELKRTAEAWEHLLPVAEKFTVVSVIPYNLACYACQLGRLTEAKEFLKRAMTLQSKDEIKRMALADPDLKPLRGILEDL